MRNPLVGGITAALVMCAILFGIWKVWLGRYHSESNLPTASLDRLERTGIPDFTLPRLFSGKSFQLTDIQHKMVIVNFWASWCEPCAEEFPSMLKLVDHYHGEIELVAISADAKRSDAVKFATLFHAHRRGVVLLWDPKRRVASEFGTKKLPESYILSPEHQLVRKVLAVDDWNTPGVYGFMNHFLSVAD